ncbi:MAG: P-loop NTPase [Chitinivibrionales bacterium]|nr:P-loop NTPase [Chitinivibrionales bacterium]MBD3357932.1 P-loop NTPase [Chitinivibrionales bacterium]
MPSSSSPVIVSIGGGKGGVGKSTLVANIGAILCSEGSRVGFIDADLGGANLHLCVGVRRPKFTLADYLGGRVKELSAVAVETMVPNSWLISGASDILGLANPKYAQKRKLLNNIGRLDADFILVDLGAGADTNVTDFFAAFPFGIVVSDSLPTSIENAYGFLKNATLRGLSRLFAPQSVFRHQLYRFADPGSKGGVNSVEELLSQVEREAPEETKRAREWLAGRGTFLVINMVREREDVEAGRKFADIVKKYLSINLFYIGYVIQDPKMRKSQKAMRPVVTMDDAAAARECFRAITRNLRTLTKGEAPG